MSTNEGFMECGIPLGYHDETGETEWCGNDPITGICSEHWDEYMNVQPARISVLTELLERLENDEHGRCPLCHQPIYDGVGRPNLPHAPNCDLAKAIGKV